MTVAVITALCLTVSPRESYLAPEVAAIYRGEEILWATVQREKSLTSSPADSDRAVVDRIIQNMILLDEAEQRGLAATDEEIEAMVDSTKRAYELPDGKTQMDAYFSAMGITADEYFELIRQQAPRVIARQKLTDAVAREYCEAHGLEFTKVNQPAEVQEAVETYINGLFDAHKADIV